MYPWEIWWHGKTHTVWLLPCCMGFVIQYGFCYAIASLTLGERWAMSSKIVMVLESSTFSRPNSAPWSSTNAKEVLISAKEMLISTKGAEWSREPKVSAGQDRFHLIPSGEFIPLLVIRRVKENLINIFLQTSVTGKTCCGSSSEPWAKGQDEQAKAWDSGLTVDFANIYLSAGGHQCLFNFIRRLHDYG